LRKEGAKREKLPTGLWSEGALRGLSWKGKGRRKKGEKPLNLWNAEPGRVEKKKGGEAGVLGMAKKEEAVHTVFFGKRGKGGQNTNGGGGGGERCEKKIGGKEVKQPAKGINDRNGFSFLSPGRKTGFFSWMALKGALGSGVWNMKGKKGKTPSNPLGLELQNQGGRRGPRLPACHKTLNTTRVGK